MKKEIPLPLVKSNQIGIVLFAALAIALQSPWLLLALWLVQAAGFAFGPRANLFMRLARPLLRARLATADTQAAELLRFNNGLGLLFLTAALVLFAAGLPAAAYVFAGFLLAAAFVALCGYCVGCVMYYQFKQLKYKAGK